MGALGWRALGEAALVGPPLAHVASMDALLFRGLWGQLARGHESDSTWIFNGCPTEQWGSGSHSDAGTRSTALCSFNGCPLERALGTAPPAASSVVAAFNGCPCLEGSGWVKATSPWSSCFNGYPWLEGSGCRTRRRSTVRSHLQWMPSCSGALGASPTDGLARPSMGALLFRGLRPGPWALGSRPRRGTSMGSLLCRGLRATDGGIRSCVPSSFNGCPLMQRAQGPVPQLG